MLLGESYRIVTLWVALPLICLLCLRWTGFDGMVGQDSYAYVDQAYLMQSDLIAGWYNSSFRWPVGYPFLGVIMSLLGWTIPLAMQMVSCLGMGGLLLVTYKLLGKIYPNESTGNSISYLILFLFLAPFIFRNAMLTMSDIPAAFLILSSIYLGMQFYNRGKYRFLILGVLSLILACWVRYAAFLFTLPLGVFYFAGLRRKHHLPLWWFGIIPLFLVMLYIIFFNQIQNLYSHNAIQHWSIANFFKHTHITQQGNNSYWLPNVIYVWYPFFHYGFSWFCLIFLVINHRRLNVFYVVVIGLIYLCYVFFIAGLDAQNTRYLLPVYPLVLVLAYPGYNTFMIWMKQRKMLLPAMVFIFLVQMVFTVFSFRTLFYRNALEREITGYLNDNWVGDIAQPAYLYSFDIDIALQSRGVPYQIINLWEKPISIFQKGSLVLFNEQKLAVQWRDQNPMLNWRRLQANNGLEKIVEFTGHWILYKID
ncbi:MAG: hypothetical protein KDC53_03130 [Saprospiraceae bacterium]|nr:hypothetical protein [Saprospiraceae bacterium]